MTTFKLVKILDVIDNIQGTKDVPANVSCSQLTIISKGNNNTTLYLETGEDNKTVNSFKYDDINDMSSYKERSIMYKFELIHDDKEISRMAYLTRDGRLGDDIDNFSNNGFLRITSKALWVTFKKDKEQERDSVEVALGDAPIETYGSFSFDIKTNNLFTITIW